jgi:O-Antigen ligase
MTTARSSIGNSRTFFALVLFCVALPGFATVKAAVIIGYWTYCLVRAGFKTSSTVWFISVIANLLSWCIIASVHTVDRADTINQCSRILIFFLVLGIGVYAARSLELEEGKLDSLIFNIVFLAMILKIIILALVLSGLVTLEAVEKFIGFESVTDLIGLGLQRLQFPSDIVILFLLPCYVGGKSKTKDAIFLLSISIVVLLSFSRFLFGGYLLCLGVRYLWIRRVDLISWFSVLVILLLSVIFFATLSERFSGEGSDDSDSARGEQIRYLDDVISSYPILGTGIGSSVIGYQRSGTIPFSYEVQWYAMTMQFGFLGIAWFGANLVIVLFIGAKNRRQALSFAIILFIWIAAGFTNPYVTSLGSAFGFTILMLRLFPHESAILQAANAAPTLISLYADHQAVP